MDIASSMYHGLPGEVEWGLCLETTMMQDYNITIYAFKMRRDYLSTSYLDQKYLPSEQSDTREI